MNLEIVEIGTSDFWTEAGQKDGLFIEPIKEYFDRLGDCRKENVAVSNYEGEIEIYYIPSEVIYSNNIPKGLRGCNSVGAPHPTVIKLGYGEYIQKGIVKVKRIKTLLDKHGVTGIEFLKIDTEGHDCVILNDFLDTCDILPKKIQFEANILSKEKDVLEVIERLKHFGYNCNRLGEDCICILS